MADSSFVIRHSSFSSAAFTLVEVMIAMTIFSLVLAAVYSSWDLVWRATRVSQTAAAQVQRQRVAIHTIEDALTCIQSFGGPSMKYYCFIVNEDPPELDFTARLPDDFPRNGKFGDFNVRQLQFTLAAGADLAEKDLVLRQKPILLDMDADEQQHPLVLARYVQTFTVECWDTNKVEWTKEWDDTNSIPPLIRVKLVLGGNNRDNFGNAAPTLTATRVIAAPSQTMPAEVQGQGAGGFNNGSAPPVIQPPTTPPVRR
jgi:prepilin-type N-terminal cleavage/methylation domain-containing protein